MNRIFKSCATLLACASLAVALLGCAPTSTRADYIGLDAAKSIALSAANVPEAAAVFSTTGLDQRSGTDFYAIQFTANGQSYAYDIDAITGVIISSSANGVPTYPLQQSPAISAAPAPSPSLAPSPATSPSPITEVQAREIALTHAGVSQDQVTFLRSSLGFDNGRQTYDVEFYHTSNYTEYDYEIDAATGEILSYDFDAEGYAPPANNTGSMISADQAKQIALAEVPGATVNDIYEFDLDQDDGRLEYEGTIYYNGVEYEFTIDGYSGAIRDWETDRY